MCVSRSLGLVLNVIGWFLSSRLEGAIVREGWGGGGKDGRIERRTRKTKTDIRDRSDEEQDEEFQSN